MVKEYKRRISIENAGAFKVQYISYLADARKVHERDFNSIKSMSQWIARNDNEGTFGILILKTLALLGDQWEPFTTIGKKTITLSDLRTIIKDLEEDLKPSKK